MRLKAKLILVTNITVIISVAFITAFTIYDIKQNADKSIDVYEKEEIEKVKQHLKDIVNISYEMIFMSYRNAQNMELIEKLYGRKLEGTSNEIKELVFENVKENILYMTLEDLRVLRHGVDGYIWISDNTPPYKVVMNPLKPELEGQTLDGPEYNLIKGTKQNIYEAFAELCEKQGEGFLEYDWYKPGIKGMAPKLSYIKLFKPRNWIIGTGVYIDNIDEMVRKKHQATENQVRNLILIVVLIASFLILSSSILLIRLGNSITSAIYKIKGQLNDLAQGKQVIKIELIRTDEIGEMKESVDRLIDGIQAYTTFAINIGKGNYDAEFAALSEDDILGNSLIDMRKSLQDAKNEEHKRKIEDQKQNWTTRGIARFSDLMRQSSNNIKELAYNILSNMIEYVEANVGGIYIFDDSNPDDIYLDLIAAFAFDRRKFDKKQIKLGEGLVGTCAIEKKTIHLQKLPKDYLVIASGLGKAKPTALVIIPLIVDENLLGIIELASFKSFEKHEVEFIEKVGESIASTLASAKINERTKKLLIESQQQAEMLISQEEEMRQNLEELTATQERVEEIQEQKDAEIERLNFTIDKLKERYEEKINQLQTELKILKKTSKD